MKTNKMYYNPPRFARTILRRLSVYEEYFALSDDIDEEFGFISSGKGTFRARFWYRMQVLHALRHYFVLITQWSMSMITNYSKIAFRNIRKSKTISFINMFGLAAGIAFCILAFFYIQDELTYDTFHSDAENIYEVKVKLVFGDSEFYNSPVSPLGPAMAEELPEVTSFLRINSQETVLKMGKFPVKEEVFFTDENFFTFFSFPLVSGDAETVLREPNSILLTETFARKYFPQKNPVGQTLELQMNGEFVLYTVRGIAYDAPGNSSLKFGFIAGFPDNPDAPLNQWAKRNRHFPLFVRLNSAEQPAELNEKIKDVIDRNGVKPPFAGAVWQVNSFLSHHLNPQSVAVGMEPPGNPKNSFILSGIAVFVLFIACFNFMNLSIGSISGRIREITVRKVIGAQKAYIVKQFLFETLLQTAFAVCVGILFAGLMLPGFNALAQKNLHLDYFGTWQPAVFILLLFIFSGFAAGTYPSVLFSRFSVSQMMRKNLAAGGKNVFSRILITLQFSFSILLILSALIMNRQQSYLVNRDMGYNRKHAAVLHFTPDRQRREEISGKLAVLKAEFAKMDGVESVSLSSAALTHYIGMFMYEKKDGSQVFINVLNTDEDFISTLGIPLVTGKNFSAGNKSVLLNEKFTETFGLTDPLGRTLLDLLPEMDFGNSDYTVAGVVKDFHFSSLKHTIGPLAIFNYTDPASYLFLKFSGENPAIIGQVRARFMQLMPDVPFEYSFIEDDVARMYDAERRWNTIIIAASVFAIFITCLGMLGMTLLSAAKRTKEIGIRKTMGASVRQIMLLMNREFILYIIAAMAFASPAAYYLMGKWMRNFAYRAEISPILYLLGGLIAAVLTVLTVSFQAYRAARINPVDTLRHE